MTLIRVNTIGKKFGSTVSALNEVSLEVLHGELLALAGESGSGKTTLLRIIAGLEQPDQGSLEIDGEQVAGPGLFIEPQKRSVGLVFQDYALFPHMTVKQNANFGLHEWPLKERQTRSDEVLELVGLNDLQSRYPHQLSGGQQQRVAIARALAPKPKILLLDEPFSNLDTILKDQVRSEVKRIIKSSGLTAILVTHDIQDALSTADRIALLKAGRLQQIDTPNKLFNEPTNTYVASFFGKINFLPAHYETGALVTEVGTIPVEIAPTITKGKLCVRPQQIEVSTKSGGIAGNITTMEYMGSHLMLQVKVGDHLLWCFTSALNFSLGQEVYLTIRTVTPHLLEDTIS